MPGRHKSGVSYWRNLRCEGCWRRCRYADFKVFGKNGFAEVSASLWTDSEDPKDWRYRRRGTVLGMMHAHKKELWEYYTENCPERRDDV